MENGGKGTNRSLNYATTTGTKGISREITNFVEVTHTLNHTISDGVYQIPQDDNDLIQIIQSDSKSSSMKDSNNNLEKTGKTGQRGRTCRFCNDSFGKGQKRKKESGKGEAKKTEYRSKKGKTDVIFPCLCPTQAHRRCAIEHIRCNFEFYCPDCQSNYALHGVYRNLARQNLSTIIKTMLVFIILIVVFVVVFSVLNESIVNMQSNTKYAIIIIIYIVVFVITLTFLYYVRRTFCSQELVDLSVYCKQSEISKHLDNEDTRQLIRQFIAKQDYSKRPRHIADILNKAGQGPPQPELCEPPPFEDKFSSGMSLEETFREVQAPPEFMNLVKSNDKEAASSSFSGHIAADEIFGSSNNFASKKEKVKEIIGNILNMESDPPPEEPPLRHIEDPYSGAVFEPNMTVQHTDKSKLSDLEGGIIPKRNNVADLSQTGPKSRKQPPPLTHHAGDEAPPVLIPSNPLKQMTVKVIPSEADQIRPSVEASDYANVPNFHLQPSKPSELIPKIPGERIPSEKIPRDLVAHGTPPDSDSVQRERISSDNGNGENVDMSVAADHIQKALPASYLHKTEPKLLRNLQRE